MIVALTPRQLLALGGSALQLLGRLLAEHPEGGTVRVGSPAYGSRRSLGRSLALLQRHGLVRIEDPGNWCRSCYDVNLTGDEFALWFAGTEATTLWPSLYPDVYETLRVERSDLDDAEFDRRFRTGILEALNRSERPRHMVAWMRTALTYPCPAPAQTASSPPPLTARARGPWLT